MLYFAYGANLDVAGMRYRCPRALPLFPLILDDARLVFRGVADCVYEAGSKCAGGVWNITAECERALDRFEGFRRDGTGMYRKVYVPLHDCDHGDQIMYYAMNSTGIAPPWETYLDTIRRGYRDFKLPMEMLDAAVDASWADKAPSEIERERYARRPAARLAKSSRAKAPPKPQGKAALMPDLLL